MGEKGQIVVFKGIHENEEKEKMSPEKYRFWYSTKEVIGRMNNTSPKECEIYFLRLILTQIPGEMFFEKICEL